MSPRELIDQARADGVELNVTERGRLRLGGDPMALDRWMQTLYQYREQLVAALIILTERTAP